MNGKTEKEKDNFKKEFEKEIPSAFLKFLKDNNILDKYMNNISNNLSVLYPKMLTLLEPKEYIMVFRWDKTPETEGFHHWNKYYVMWNEYLKQNDK